MTAHEHTREQSGRYQSAAWWCPRCKSPHFVGVPENRCDECGWEAERVGDRENRLTADDLFAGAGGWDVAADWPGTQVHRQMSLTILHDLEQGTDAWHDARRGIVTASTVGRLVTYGPPDAASVACPTCEARPENPCLSKTRKEPTAIKTLHPARIEHAAGRAPVFDVADNETSRGLTMTLVAERLSGFTEDVPMNGDMWRGTLSEPFARDEYSRHFAPVQQVGFMVRQEDGWTLGYSPDGLVGDDGLLEIKSPRAKTHVQTVLSDEVPAYYMPQLQAGLLVSGRKWCDFVSYVGGMHMRPIRVYPDADWFAAIAAACIAFEQTAARLITEYREAVAGLPITERIDFDPEIKVA